jgi:hypothetical protein
MLTVDVAAVPARNQIAAHFSPSPVNVIGTLNRPDAPVAVARSAVVVPSGAVVAFAVIVQLVFAHEALSNSSDRMHRFVRCGSSNSVRTGLLAPVGVTKCASRTMPVPAVAICSAIVKYPR